MNLLEVSCRKSENSYREPKSEIGSENRYQECVAHCFQISDFSTVFRLLISKTDLCFLTTDFLWV
ncbi:hypothetical protein L6250_00875 [Candidatus Parcubacteria bacterium]|nr:hypothetical protein [Patescibacteria group bacterium]MCG2688181.1 hypothetical protein [Candidatus Parcubacteria bacterium]